MQTEHDSIPGPYLIMVNMIYLYSLTVLSGPYLAPTAIALLRREIERRRKPVQIQERTLRIANM